MQNALTIGWTVYVWVGPGSSPATREVLYVGCTSQYDQRYDRHGKDRYEVWTREFKTSWVAAAAERLFIEVLKPRWNKQWNRSAPERTEGVKREPLELPWEMPGAELPWIPNGEDLPSRLVQAYFLSLRPGVT
mgnify:CR=1 FL=1